MSMSIYWKLSIMQSLTNMLIIPKWFGVKILILEIECLSSQKWHWELLNFSQEIVIQALYLRNRVYINLKIKFNLKVYSWSANAAIIYYNQFSKTGSNFILINISITQLFPLQVSYSSNCSKKIYMENIL